MWTFSCPFVVYGDNALEYIAQIQAKKAFIVTDKNIVKLSGVEAAAVKKKRESGSHSRTILEGGKTERALTWERRVYNLISGGKGEVKNSK